MKNGAFTALAAALSTGALISASHAQGDTARAECDRLINVLEQRTPTEAYETLQTMRVHREGSRYQACVDAAQIDRTGATNAGTRVQSADKDWQQLSPDKQQRIKDYVGRREIEPMMSGKNVEVGATLPSAVPLRGLPRDMVTEVPKITSYRYVVLQDGIAIVEPDSRTVVQIIGK